MGVSKEDGRCLVCGRKSEIHHILTQKRYPQFKETDWNRIDLCRIHHEEWHKQGTSLMAAKYLAIGQWLNRKGWEWDGWKKRWCHQKAQERIGEVKLKD